METSDSTPDLYVQGRLFGLRGAAFDLELAEIDFLEMIETTSSASSLNPPTKSRSGYSEDEVNEIRTRLEDIYRREQEIARAKREPIDPQQRLFKVYG